MVPGPILAPGLCLRPLAPADAPAIAEGLGRWEVTRWLAVPPWPYLPEHAERFLVSPAALGCHAITFGGGDDLLRGVISLSGGNLGYWLHPDQQGRGLMGRAAQARLARHFDGSAAPVAAGVQTDNAPSVRLLQRLGFRELARRQVFSKIRGCAVEHASLRLDAADWRAREGRE